MKPRFPFSYPSGLNWQSRSHHMIVNYFLQPYANFFLGFLLALTFL